MARNDKAKETVLVITVGCLVLFLVFRGRVFLYCALGIGLAGVFSSWLSGKIDWLWMRLSRMLGVVSNTVLLSLVFFLVVTPVGMMRRWRKKDRLRGSEPGAGAGVEVGKGMGSEEEAAAEAGIGAAVEAGMGATSNFIDRDHTFTAGDLEKTW